MRIDYEQEFSNASYRENVEWTNYWFSGLNRECEKKLCLIGDSLSREIRSTLERITNIPVDYYGTSSLVLDSRFTKEMDLFFDTSHAYYDCIHMQIGSHGIVEIDRPLLNNTFYTAYKLQMSRIVDQLKVHAKQVVLASITEIVEVPDYRIQLLNKLYTAFHPRRIEISDKRYEKDLLRRNRIIEEVAIEKGIAFNDLYGFMKKEGAHFRHKDHIHYENSAKEFIARRISSFVD